MTMKTYRGGCHCGAVRFRAEADEEPTLYRCNCSMCRRMGFLHLIVPKERFHLESGQECLTSYRFGTQVAEHLFCPRCGIQSFYVPRSNPDGFSVHAGCLDELGPHTIVDIDGAGDWEGQSRALAHLSRGSGDDRSPV